MALDSAAASATTPPVDYDPVRRWSIITAVSAVVLAWLVAVVIYAIAAPSGLVALAICLGVSVAAFAVAGVLGFLFGVPRSSAEGAEPRAGILPNTNLEQVSDWLTKLLLGASLTQLGRLRDQFAALAEHVGAGMGGPAGPQMGGILMAVSAALGFLGGWLATRLWLGGAMAAADRWRVGTQLLERAEELTRQGDAEGADQLRRSADAVLATVEGGPGYLSIRKPTPTPES